MVHPENEDENNNKDMVQLMDGGTVGG